MRTALALSLLLLPTLGFAQEAKKFNAKELAKDFEAVGVYAPKGVVVVENEVMVNSEPARDFVEAVYVVRADLKKVLEFYKTRLTLEPKKQGDDELGTQKYLFAPKPKVGEKRIYKVTVAQAEGGSGTMITLMHRKAESDEIVTGSDD